MLHHDGSFVDTVTGLRDADWLSIASINVELGSSSWSAHSFLGKGVKVLNNNRLDQGSNVGRTSRADLQMLGKEWAVILLVEEDKVVAWGQVGEAVINKTLAKRSVDKVTVWETVVIGRVELGGRLGTPSLRWNVDDKTVA